MHGIEAGRNNKDNNVMVCVSLVRSVGHRFVPWSDQTKYYNEDYVSKLVYTMNFRNHRYLFANHLALMSRSNKVCMIDENISEWTEMSIR